MPNDDAMPEAGDLRWEFSAPQYHDFTKKTPLEHGEEWFGSPANLIGLRSPPRETRLERLGRILGIRTRPPNEGAPSVASSEDDEGSLLCCCMAPLKRRWSAHIASVSDYTPRESTES